MQTTKDNILHYLKRAGGGTVDAVASEFKLARMTVRQHLSGLERDGLVISREERRRTGRPHLFFSLTEGGEERFPKRYDRLADLALQEVALLEADEIAGLSPEGKKRLLLTKMADRVYQEHEPRVRDKGLKERVAIIAEILRARRRLCGVESRRRAIRDRRLQLRVSQSGGVSSRCVRLASLVARPAAGERC